MRKALALVLSTCILCSAGAAQTSAPGQGKQQQQQTEEEEVVRITSELVQTDVVVTDKSDQIIPDLKMGDFEVFENGRRQDIKFMEFVSVDTGRRVEGTRPSVPLPLDAEVSRGLTDRELKRVVAFVVDDLTIPFEDMTTVRQLLLDFVDNQMREGDLVAIVRTVGGKGLLQQFTSDRQLLRRAISQLNVATHPFLAFNNPAPERITNIPSAASSSGGGESGGDVNIEDLGSQNVNDPNDETQRLFRGLFSLTTANAVIDSLKEIPGRKSLVLISGGIPIFEPSSSGTAYSNISYLLNQLSDNAVRAGVVVNTMDPRGLKATPGVASFVATPGRSALGASPDPSFGRGGGADDIFGPPLAGASEHLGLNTVANATGGVSVVNTNNFKAGLEKVLARSRGYYLLAYSPSDRFDNKFRKIEVKVKRDNTNVYAHRGYVARDEVASKAPRTKEETIMEAVKSPLAKRDVDVAANLVLRPSPTNNKTAVDIHLLIDANKLNFTQATDGKFQTSFDVVGFVYDQLGKLRGGFSETVNTSLEPENYRDALKTGLTYSATTELPPGYFQLRAAVREAVTGNLGTVSKFLEIPNLASGRLAMSSVVLSAADPANSKATPTPLLALRRVTRKQDLRYAALVYNTRTPQLRSQIIISQGSKLVYKGPEELFAAASAAPTVKTGQLGLSGVQPGRYVLTLLVIDPQADKKSQTVVRSVDFTVE